MRYHDWDARLHRFFIGQQDAKFKYGRMDCCLFVADAVLVMTGTDLAAPFRGKYASHKQALELVKQYAGKASVQAVTEKLMLENGIKELPAALAQRGDVVLVARSRDYSLGLISLNGREIWAVGSQGCLRLPLNRAVRSWRI